MWEYSHEGKQLENKRVFRRLQKTGMSHIFSSTNFNSETVVGFELSLSCEKHHVSLLGRDVM